MDQHSQSNKSRQWRAQQQIPQIKNQDLVQALNYINQNTTYTPDEQHRDEFLRELLRAVTIGDVANFKQLMVLNEEYGYDYRNMFKQKQVIISVYIKKDGLSVLHVACQNGRSALIELLLTDYGMGDEINNDDNKFHITAFFLAVQSFVIKDNSPDKLNLMLNMGANILVETSDGFTIGKLLNQYSLKNASADFLQSQYEKKMRERNRQMACWVLFISSVKNSDPRICQLDMGSREAVLEWL